MTSCAKIHATEPRIASPGNTTGRPLQHVTLATAAGRGCPRLILLGDDLVQLLLRGLILSAQLLDQREILPLEFGDPCLQLRPLGLESRAGFFRIALGRFELLSRRNGVGYLRARNPVEFVE